MLEQAEFAGAHHGLGAALDLEFVEEGAGVALDGAESQIQPIRRSPGWKALLDEMQHFRSCELNGSIKG